MFFSRLIYIFYLSCCCFFFGFFHVCDFVRAWNIAWGPWGAPTTTETTTTTRWNEPLRSTFFFSFHLLLKDHHRENRSRTIFLFLLSRPFRLSCHTQKKTAVKPFRVIYTRRNGVLRAIDLRLWSTSSALFIFFNFLFEIFPVKTPTKWRLRIWDGVWRRQGGRRRRRQDPG